jgi:hypothetical protein
MFASEVGAYLSEVPFKCTTLGLALGRAHKLKTKDKNSSLLGTFINYSQKKFDNIEP